MPRATARRALRKDICKILQIRNSKNTAKRNSKKKTFMQPTERQGKVSRETIRKNKPSTIDKVSILTYLKLN